MDKDKRSILWTENTHNSIHLMSVLENVFVKHVQLCAYA